MPVPGREDKSSRKGAKTLSGDDEASQQKYPVLRFLRLLLCAFAPLREILLSGHESAQR